MYQAIYRSHGFGYIDESRKILSKGNESTVQSPIRTKEKKFIEKTATKALSVLLALCLTLDMPAVSAFAADTGFKIEDGVLTAYDGPGGDIAIPDGVAEIGKGAFQISGLESIALPASVRTIPGIAFKECGSMKTAAVLGAETIGHGAFSDTPEFSVLYAGTESQWNAIDISYAWEGNPDLRTCLRSYPEATRVVK